MDVFHQCVYAPDCARCGYLLTRNQSCSYSLFLKPFLWICVTAVDCFNIQYRFWTDIGQKLLLALHGNASSLSLSSESKQWLDTLQHSDSFSGEMEIGNTDATVFARWSPHFKVLMYLSIRVWFCDYFNQSLLWYESCVSKCDGDG